MVSDISTWILYLVLSVLIIVLFRTRLNLSFVSGHGRKAIDVNIVLLFLLLVFLAAFREIGKGIGGTDAEAYLERFREAGSIKEYLSSVDVLDVFHIDEPLFAIFNMIVRSFTENEYIYLILSYGIIVVGLIGFVKYFFSEKSFYFSLLLFICAYLYSFNIMRTWISIAICIWAFKEIVKHKWIKSLCLIIFAGLVHTIAFSFILVWGICLLYRLNPHLFSIRFLLIVALVANVVCFIAKTVILSLIMNTKYAFYKDMFEGKASIWGYLPSIFMCIVAILLFDKVRNDSFITEEERRKKLYSILALSMNLSCMYLIVGMFAWRINDYYMLTRMYMISVAYEYADDSSNRAFIRAGAYMFTIAHFVQQMLGLKASSGIFPYALTFWK